MKSEDSGGGVPAANASEQVDGSGKVLREWVAPSLSILPRLTDLTLQSIPCGGELGGGGGTVCP